KIGISVFFSPAESSSDLQTKELLAELVVVEEEVARLESEISKVQEGLPNMQGAEEQKTSKVFNFKDTNINVIVEPSSDKSIASSHVPGQEILQQKIALETKPLFFINQAIKGDYLVNGFSNIRSAGSLIRSFHYKGSQRAVEIKERTSRKGRMPQKASSPKLPTKHLSNKVSQTLYATQVVLLSFNVYYDYLVRIYTADGVIGELERSKMDYLQASVVVTTTKRILIPHLLHSNMHDFARDLDSLVDWVVNQLPTSWPLRKSMLECLKGRTAAKISHTVDVIPNNSEFQYLLPM
ncbi:hypothetical protein BHE74_00003933, partial [Ensete ventricosum]